MTDEIPSIIREAGEATRLARMNGCVLDIHVKRSFGRFVRVVIDPDRIPHLDFTSENDAEDRPLVMKEVDPEREPTAVIPREAVTPRGDAA